MLVRNVDRRGNAAEQSGSVHSFLLRPILPALCLMLPACGPSGANAAAAPVTTSPSAPKLAAGERAAAERAIAAVLDDWHDASAHADEERYFAHFASNGVFLGTDATERWTVEAFRAYAHPRFATGKAWAFRSVRRTAQLSPEGNVAWFDEALATERLGPARGSGVLVREGSAWKIAQYNLSIPIPNERFDQVRKAIGEGP